MTSSYKEIFLPSRKLFLQPEILISRFLSEHTVKYDLIRNVKYFKTLRPSE